MSISLILLSVVSALVLFGAAQRVLDRMQLTDRAALVIAALIFFGGLIPDIRLGNVVFNIGGFVVPLGVCIWLLVKTDTRTEVRRSLFGSVLTGAAEGKAKENAGAWKGIGWLLTALVIGALIFAFVATGSGKETFPKWKRTFREITAMPESKEKK